MNTATAGHKGAFDEELSRKLGLNEWAGARGLTGDDGRPLDLRLTRMRKTVEARTAKAVGGHLPSARLTNTADTSYTHYLRGDPFIQEWAAQVVSEAIVDAENHARGVVLRLVAEPAAGGAATVTAEQVSRAETGELDTVVSACLDIEHHPDSGTRCQSSFLTCLRCPNALILQRHLPALIALRTHLQRQLDVCDVDTWTREHGPTWVALTHGILPRFSEGQIAAAEAAAASQSDSIQAALDLLEQLREPA